MASSNGSSIAQHLVACTDEQGVLDTVKVLEAIKSNCTHALELVTSARVLAKILKTSGMKFNGPTRDKLARVCESVKSETRFLEVTTHEHMKKVDKACDFTLKRVAKLARKKIAKKKPRTSRAPPRAREAKEAAARKRAAATSAGDQAAGDQAAGDQASADQASADQAAGDQAADDQAAGEQAAASLPETIETENNAPVEAQDDTETAPALTQAAPQSEDDDEVLLSTQAPTATDGVNYFQGDSDCGSGSDDSDDESGSGSDDSDDSDSDDDN